MTQRDADLMIARSIRDAVRADEFALAGPDWSGNTNWNLDDTGLLDPDFDAD